MTTKEEIAKVMSIIGKMSHKKSPRKKDHYKLMQKKSVEKRKANKKIHAK